MLVSYLGNQMSHYLESEPHGSAKNSDEGDDVARVVVARMFQVSSPLKRRGGPSWRTLRAELMLGGRTKRSSTM